MTTPINPLPTPPSPADSPADFNTKAFALLGALPAFVTEANAQAAGLDASVAAAGAQAAIATNKAGEALTSANNAAISKTGADSARDAAVIAKNAAEAALDSFDDRYLGQKPADPATDNDGGALLVGALYFRTTAPIGMKVWTGTTWDDAYANMSSKFDKTGGDVGGNINFTGTARRITGDFSNAAFVNRVMFQTSTTNANTDIGILPNGVASSAGIWFFNNGSILSNTAFLRSYINGATDVRFESGRVGSYSFLPMTFHTGGSERMRIDTSGNVLATSGALGYGAGAGGTVVQATSKSTTVTLNKPSGQITMNGEALAAGGIARFSLFNSVIASADEVSVWISGVAGAVSAHTVWVDGVVTGACGICVENITTSSLSLPIQIGFTVRKGATS